MKWIEQTPGSWSHRVDILLMPAGAGFLGAYLALALYEALGG
jgi:hypothetical protein